MTLQIFGESNFPGFFWTTSFERPCLGVMIIRQNMDH
jgi:hypothetical protein